MSLCFSKNVVRSTLICFGSSGSPLGVILALSAEDKGLTRKRRLSKKAQIHPRQGCLRHYERLGIFRLPIRRARPHRYSNLVSSPPVPSSCPYDEFVMLERLRSFPMITYFLNATGLHSTGHGNWHSGTPLRWLLCVCITS